MKAARVIGVWLMAFLCAGVTLCVWGCGSTTATTPAGTSIISTEKQFAYIPDGKGGIQAVPIVDKSFTGTAHGASITTDSANAAASMNNEAPTIEGPDGTSASGGASETAFKVFQKVFDPKRPLFWAGLVAVVGGGYLIYRTRFTTGAIVLASGLFLMAASQYPWLLVVALVSIIGALAYEAYKHGFFKEGGRALLAGVKSEGVLAVVEKSARENHATGTDGVAIDVLKRLEA